MIFYTILTKKILKKLTGGPVYLGPKSREVIPFYKDYQLLVTQFHQVVDVMWTIPYELNMYFYPSATLSP